MSQYAVEFKRDFPRFKFQGFNSEGVCFLRAWGIRRADGRLNITFLCAQLSNYHGTSITNAVESIFSKAVDQLREEGLLLVPRFSGKKHDDLVAVAESSQWVEYYPPGVGLDPSGSYALVALDDQLHPSWNYVSKEDAAEECAIDTQFFDIPMDQLK